MKNLIAIAAAFALLSLVSPLRAAPRSPQSVAAEIDGAIDKLMKENKLPPSARADDAELLRRACLDITGRVPSLDQTRAFLAATNPDKRDRLIDQLLADEEYGEHFAIIWYHRIVKVDDDNRLVVKDNKLQQWLTAEFNKNRGWDKLVTELLASSGGRDASPGTTFILANVEDNKQRHDPSPNKITAAASKLFLGIRLECCECHNHPFNTMKQADFWGVAAFFGDTHSQRASQKELKDGGVPGIHDGGAVKMSKKKDSPAAAAHPFGSIVIPDSKGKTVRAKYLGGAEPPVANHPALRSLFASWLTSPQNKYFAPAAVNKLWANFFGRGIVNPVDDMVEIDRATHPTVLKLLAGEFTASGYDLKHLIRCICSTQAYQRTSAVLPGNKEDDKLYSHMPAKVMSADMLYDSLQVVLGHGVGAPVAKSKDTKKQGGGPREAFRKFFHAEADDDVGVVEDYTHGVPQVLRLMNSSQTNNSSALVAKLMKAGEPAKVIDELYLTVLSRQPTPGEVKKLTAFAAESNFSTKAYSDLLWVLLNSGEFLFNH
jgi:hypothetical protein